MSRGRAATAFFILIEILDWLCADFGVRRKPSRTHGVRDCSGSDDDQGGAKANNRMHARRSLDILYKHVWRRGSACHINLMAGQDLVKLERDKICENIDLIGLRVPAASCGPLMSNRVLKPFFYVRPRIKHVRADETDPAKKILLLNQSITSTGALFLALFENMLWILTRIVVCRALGASYQCARRDQEI